MLRVFVLVPWLFIWPWLFGIGLASFTGGVFFLWLLFLLLIVCRVPLRWCALACFFGYVWGMIFIPPAWKTGSWDAYLWRIPNSVPRIETSSVQWAVRVRTWGTERLQSALPPREATLAAGMLYGDAVFQAQDKKRIRATGISHIVAVSGANILFLLVLVRWVLYRCIRAKRWRRLADKVGIMGIVILTGASASVLRAGVMLILFGNASAFGRRAHFSRLLLLSAFFLVAFEPRRLMFDAGFLLSYLACVGLLHAKGKEEEQTFFEKMELKSTWYAWLWTTPFQWWFFGGVTWIGLIANALVLFVVPWIQTLAVIAILAPRLTPINWILEQCLRHIWVIVDVMSGYSQTISVAPRWGFLMMVGTYAFLIAKLIHKRMSFWTKVVSNVSDISWGDRIRTKMQQVILLPQIIDTAPDLVIFALFSMLESSAKKEAR